MMDQVRETHRVFSGVQNAEGTVASCECGWSVTIPSAWETEPVIGRRVEMQKADGAQARKLWREHKCGGVS